MRLRRVPWAELSLASAAAVGVAVAVGGSSPVRTALVAWFLVTCPGMSLARLAALGDGFGEATVGIGLSLAAGLVVALGLVYAGAFSGEAVFAVLGAATVVVSVAALVVDRRRAR